MKIKLNPIQKQFLKTIVSKLLWFPAIYFFIQAIYPIMLGKDPLLVIMYSMYFWILFTVSIVGLAFAELVLNDAEIRRYFLTIERGLRKSSLQQQTEQPKELKSESWWKKRKKESVY